MNTEFHEIWWSGKRAVALLEEGIKSSYHQPALFWSNLLPLHQSITGITNKNPLNTGYDFYHDCITRHLGKQRTAFKTWESGVLKEWSFEQLDRLVNFQVSRCKRHGFQAGQKAFIVMPMGIRLVITLLTLLKLGLRFSVLPYDSPFLSPARLQKALKTIKHDFVITTSEMSSKLEIDPTPWIIEYLEEETQTPPHPSYLYSSKDILQESLACHTQNEISWFSLTAEQTYLTAIRDGLFAFNLKPGMIWAYTPLCSLREQPFCLLAALLFGVTTLFLPEEVLQSNPELIANEKVHLLGISPKLRNLWMTKKGLPKQHLKHWYKNVFDDNERSWNLFCDKNKIEKISRSQLLVDNSQGGVLFSSIPISETNLTNVWGEIWPTLGIPWDLLQMNQSGAKSLLPYGIFQPKFPFLQGDILPGKCPSNLVLAELKEGWVLSGTVAPNKEGYTIPTHALEEAVQKLDFVEDCTLLALPRSETPLSSQLAFLIFISPQKFEDIQQQKKSWNEAVMKQIETHVGALFLPDNIEYYPFSPKLSEGKVDRNWCLYQYTMGILSRKRELKAYHLLNLLRKSLKEEFV